jgi:lipopolysaccharide transport system permease protein
MFMEKKADWQWEISAHRGWFRLNPREIFQYKDLLFRFVRRDIIASYQQTILGPVWVFLQPLLTTFVYFIIFHRVAKIPTDHIPPFLFYLPGIIIWSYYSDCVTSTMNTFQNNAYIFNKVYFPRLIVPLSSILFHSFRISIQLLLFLGVCLLYLVRNTSLHFGWQILMVPLMIFMTACFALGCGLIISVLTAKYRDLDNITQFVLRLFMFAAPVVYPASMIPEKYKFLFWLNPLTPAIEIFRSAFFKPESIHSTYLLLSVLTTGIVLTGGIILFNKREIQIMDVI